MVLPLNHSITHPIHQRYPYHAINAQLFVYELQMIDFHLNVSHFLCESLEYENMCWEIASNHCIANLEDIILS